MLGAVLASPESVRQTLLTVLRGPFTLVRSAAAVLVDLPHVPSWRDERRTLQAQVVQQAADLAALHERLRRDEAADRLREGLPSHTGRVAGIIGRALLPTQQTVLLDRGARDGLALAGLVVDAHGVVGRILDLHPASALVVLLTDPNSRLAVMVDRSRETGLLVGRGLGACELIYLDDDADIAEGDQVVTAGLSGAVPKGLPVGTVIHVTRDPVRGTARAAVRPAAPLGRLEEVLCLLPASP